MEGVKKFNFKSSSTRVVMSTRKNHSREPSAKKPRTDEMLDWDDDDLDVDVIDDCFRKATQEVCKESDVTLLSSYSVFKDEIITSTQCEPSTSTHDGPEDKFKELQAKCAEKEGEASILRSNLKNLRVSYQVDQERKQLEWKDKLSLSEKEKKTIKSELEFKNIEIVNLKQQIAELTRLMNSEQSLIHRTQLSEIKTTAVSSPEKRQDTVPTGNCKIHINVEKYYPLKSFNLSFQLKPFQEKNFSTALIIEFLEKQTISQDLMAISAMSSDELNSNVSSIDKALWSTYQLLEMFSNELKEMNVKFSPNTETTVQYREISRLVEISYFCSEVLDFLQKVIPFSKHLKKSLANEKIIRLTVIECNRTKKNQTSHLELLINILTSIRSIGKEKECHKFLSTLLKLLCTIYTLEELTNLEQNTIKTLSKEIITLNLDLELINQVNIFLNVVAQSSISISFLCSKEENAKNNLSQPCRFAHYVNTLNKSLMAVERDVFLKVSENIVNLTYSIFHFDDVQEETKACDCFMKLYKLTVATIYKDLESNETLQKRIKMLSVLIFNVYDLTQKYVVDYAQFKDFGYTVSRTNEGTVNLKNLEKLSSSEDFPTVPKEKFSGILL